MNLNMCVSMYVFGCMCVHLCPCVYLYVCSCIYMHVHIYVYINMYLYVCACKYVCAYLHVCDNFEQQLYTMCRDRLLGPTPLNVTQGCCQARKGDLMTPSLHLGMWQVYNRCSVFPFC